MLTLQNESHLQDAILTSEESVSFIVFIVRSLALVNFDTHAPL
jgi:hypothetical protein